MTSVSPLVLGAPRGLAWGKLGKRRRAPTTQTLGRSRRPWVGTLSRLLTTLGGLLPLLTSAHRLPLAGPVVARFAGMETRGVGNWVNGKRSSLMAVQTKSGTARIISLRP